MEKQIKEKETALEKENSNLNIADYQKKLDELRKNGATKINSLKEKILVIREDKTIDKVLKQKQINEIKAQIQEAKDDKKAHKVEIKALIKEAKETLKKDFKPKYQSEKEESKKLRLEEKENFKNSLKAQKEKFLKNKEEVKGELESINAKYSQDLLALEPLKGSEEYTVNLEKLNLNHKTEVEDTKLKLNNLIRANDSAIYEIKLGHQKYKTSMKDKIHSIYAKNVFVKQELNGGVLTIGEKIESKANNYVYGFSPKQFLLRNGLYIVMLVAFLFCGLMAPIMEKGNLLGFNNLFEILNQSSPRIFLALGVGGLILLAGTDLSIGRLVGLCSIVTCAILNPGLNTMPFFGMKLDFSSMPIFVRVVLAFILCVILCVAFSSLAGFFTAKFKMHPFISTLSTQLLVFGLTAIATDSNNTGVIDTNIRDMIAGGWRLGPGTYFPKLLIFAIIGIAVVWFIWNKTKFGKNMYAVGGNPEAASVSGINVFWVTMGVFILAGILYGVGGFLESVRIGSGKFDTGTGYEADAIAACVVGGISFSGGIGKIKGAVIGVVIFTALTYALTFLGINPYYQFVIKGIIILVAVTIDSVKYLKKK